MTVSLLAVVCALLVVLTSSVGCQEYDSSLLRYSDAAPDAPADVPSTDAQDAGIDADADASSVPDADAATEAADDVVHDVLVEEAAPTCTETQVDCDGDEGNGCETDLTSDPTSCGACGRSCLGGDCGDGECMPFVLASGQAVPTNLALDDTHLYWTNQVSNGTVMRVLRHGGTPQLVATSENPPGGLAVDATSVYWSEFANGGSVWRLDRSDVGDTSKAIELASGQGSSFALTVDGTRVFWVTPGTVRTVLKSGGGYIQIANNQGTPAGLLAALGYAFWTNVTDGTVSGREYGAADAGILVLASNQTYPSGLTGDLGNLYWANHMGGMGGLTPSIMSMPRSGATEPEVLADGQAGPLGVAQRGTYVYWTNNTDGTIMRVLKTGGTPEQLASGQQAPGGIAVDSTAVYWANRDDGAVMALAL